MTSLFHSKRSLRRTGLLLLGCLLSAALGPFALRSARAVDGTPAAPAASPKAAAEFVPGELLVRFRADAGPAKYAQRANVALRTDAGEIQATVERVTNTEMVDGLRLARVAPADTEAALEAFRRNPDVLYAEPNFVWRKQALPNDPRFAEMPGLRNTSYPNADIDAEQAWDITTGSRNVVVGVVDEGIDISHPDLRDNVWTNPGEVAGNGVDDDGDGLVDDVHGWDFFHNDASVYDGPGTTPDGFPVDGHGTHVAGTIGATGNNGVGVTGVNWQVTLLPLKFLGPDGGSTADAIRAYDYARTLRQMWEQTGGTRGANIRVLNNSYGGRGRSQAALDAIRALGDAGVLFVAAAGNEARDNDRFPTYPASYAAPNLITVGSADYTGLPSSQFSNYGQRTVDIIAPGENILSTTPGNTYDFYYGTSMASPHVAGAAALVCAAHPDISVRRLRAAVVYGGAPGILQLNTSNRRVNARGALDDAAETDTTAPAAVGNLHVVNQDIQRYTLQWTAPGDDGAAGGNVAVYEVRYSDTPLTAPAQFEQSLRLLAPAAAAPGSTQTVVVAVPFRHATGYIGVRAVDNAGNAGPVTSLPVNADVAVADPYVVSTGSSEPLSTGGTALGLRGDDTYLTYQLPFDFNFFGVTRRGVVVSTNGALHFNAPSQLPSGDPDVDVSGTDYLPGRTVIAGLWDDLRTDRRAGDDVYVVQPDPTRVIFRWQAVTFNTPIGPNTTRGENPVNFEIELRRDGTIITRYGDGNHNLLPVVGASGGEVDAYVVASHTSEFALKDLANAPAVTFAPRRPTPLPSPDLYVAIRATPEQAASGQPLTYQLTVGHNTPGQQAIQTTLVNQLPAGVTFVSCATTRGTCSGPPVGSTGTVTANIGNVGPDYGDQAFVTIIVQVTAPAGSVLTDTASVADFWSDANQANNAATLSTEVRPSVFFGNVRALSAGGGGNFGGGHTLALKTDGRVWAWGLNLSGQIGDGTSSALVANTPVLVVGLSGVTAVDAGGTHSLALKSDGTVWGWGDNYSGQAGVIDQFTFNKLRPTQVGGLAGQFTAVSAGASHSLALRSDGTVWAWGRGNFGQMGNGTNQERNAPAQVTGLTNVVAIAAGTESSFAVKADGTVWGWGSNQSLVLNLPGGTLSSNVPVQISGISDVAAISAGGWHVLALKRDGTVWSWGDDIYGQLGSGGGNTSGPRRVSNLAAVTAISAGYQHNLALKSDGTVWAWGRNFDGALGNGTPANSNVPVQVAGVSAVGVAAGYNHSGAILPDGSLRMWGTNANGQLGDHTTVARVAPVEVTGSNGVAMPTLSPDGGSFTSAQGVSFYCATPGAVIYYTTDGSEPNDSSAAVSPGATVFFNTAMTLRARAYKPGWPASAVKSATFAFPAAAPTPTPVPGAAGQPIAFTRAAADGNDVFIINPDGSGAVNLTNSPGDDRAPTWSADGTRLAFTTFRTGNGLGHVAVVDANGGNLRVIEHNFGASETAPVWSPDGASIAYVSTYTATGVANVAVMSADGSPGPRTNLTGYAYAPTWSADSTRLAFALASSQGRNADIYVLPVAQLFAFPTQLTNNPADDTAPAWSPDGTKIAFASNRDDASYEIYVMNADGSNVRRLTNSPGADLAPAWSPDGSQLIFSSARDGNAELYVMNADGTGQTRLTNNAAADTEPAWRRHAPAQVQFDRAAYSAAEGVGAATVTVTRTGDLAGSVSVSYATVDDPAEVGCFDQANNHGAAYARCDYATTIDTLTFAAGETSKTFTIPLFDDAHAEGDETVQLALANAVGASLGVRNATLTITDNDGGGAAVNPILSSPFFVRQHYLDFLSREPEPDGLAAWLRVLNNCSDVNNNPACDRLTVSAAFFGSQEFQLKGYFVFRFYRLSLGRLPTYAEIATDMRRVTGQTAEEVTQKRADFTRAWVQRPDFRARYDALNDSDFLDRLLGNVGLDQLSGTVTRDTLLNDLFTGRKTRADVLRALVEHPDVDAAEYNRAFVAMQYYGYLRRTPEPGGYNNWLNYLTSHPGDFRTMVNGFMNSTEYKLRFGQQ
ncbi:MAG TPA: S8 family serine peptidase [Pyrinomonadaceae bacterium]|jgi:uncharacterized repeat protein (TIGR01451 family)